MFIVACLSLLIVRPCTYVLLWYCNAILITYGAVLHHVTLIIALRNDMFEKLAVVAAVTALLTLTACSDNAVDVADGTTSESAVSEPSLSSKSEKSAISIPPYEIVEDDVKRNVKRTVEVVISERMDEESLIALAEKIYALSNAKVERTFILYRLANGSDGTAWATTHYEPDLKVRIVGATASDYERMKNTNVSEGELLGSWMASRGMDSKITAYKKDGQVYIRELYNIGPLHKEDPVYESTELDEGIKLQSENDKDHNEYYIINKKGDLEFWSDNGNYYTAQKI